MERKVIVVFVFFFFISSILSNYSSQITFTDFQDTVNQSVYDLFIEINEIKNTTCTTLLKENIIDNFYKTFLLYSSKSKNDLMSFFYCMDSNDTNVKPVYVVAKIYELSLSVKQTNITKEETNNTEIIFKNNNNSMTYPNYYLLGFCLPYIIECNQSQYKEIIENIFDLRYELYEVNSTIIEAETISIKQNENIWGDEFYKNIIYLIPLLIILIQIIFCIFPIIPKSFVVFIREYICCGKKKKHSKNKSIYNQFKKIFKTGDNIDEIYGSSKRHSKLNNDSGIQYIIGIQGINIFFMIIGNVFETLIHSPTHIYSIINFRNIIYNLLYSIIYYSVRFAPRMLFACSGFIFVYKFLSYLEDKTDEIRDKKFSEKEKELIEIDKKASNVLKEKSSKKEFIPIPFYYIVRFIIYQIHKYFIFILIILFTKYSMYYIQFSDVTPIWKFLYETIFQKTNFLQLFFQFILIRPFSFKIEYPSKKFIVDSTFNKNSSLNEANILNTIPSDVTQEQYSIIRSTFLDYYWVFTNEIIFFILGVFIIYFFYNTKKYRIEKSFIVYEFIIIALRIVFMIKFDFSTIEYLSNYGYGQIFKNPLFNFNYYLIGIYFGMVNYIIQKKLNTKLVSNENKEFLLRPSYTVNFFRKSKNISCTLKYSSIGYIIIPLFCLSHLIFKFFIKKTLSQIISEDGVTKWIINSFYCIDIELGIFSFFYISIFHFNKGNNIVHSFLSFHYWIRYHKLYYSYLVTLPSVSLFFLYQSESRISLSFSNVIFYSVIIWIIAQIIASFTFIFFEMPYKRLIKLLYKIFDSEEEEKNDENEEEQIPL